MNVHNNGTFSGTLLEIKIFASFSLLRAPGTGTETGKGQYSLWKKNSNILILLAYTQQYYVKL